MLKYLKHGRKAFPPIGQMPQQDAANKAVTLYYKARKYPGNDKLILPQ